MAFFSRTKPHRYNKKKANSLPLLSSAAQGFLERRLIDIKGTALIILGGCFILALISFDIKDPSLNTSSTNEAISNLLGITGAFLSDVLLQTIGLAAYAIAFTPVVWGYRVITRRPITRIPLRLSLLALATICAAITLARIPSFEGWTIGSYLGGSTGAIILTALGNGLKSLFGDNAFLTVTYTSALIFFIAYTTAVGISPMSWINILIKMLETLKVLSIKLTNYFVSKLSLHKQKKERKLRRLQINDTIAPKEKISKKPKVSKKHSKRDASAKQQEFKLVNSDDGWLVPDIDMLDEPIISKGDDLDEKSLEKNAEMLQATLNDFGVKGEILQVNPGPIITLYELEPAPGTKTSRVIGLSDDIARSMSALSVRVAVVSGRNAIGLELPNAKRETVYLKEIIESQKFQKTKNNIPLALGKNIAGDIVVTDLAKMPHLMIAGTTGSGKSVGVNAMILSLLYKMSPKQLRFIMIDPKMLELSVYDDIPHLLTPVVTEPHKAVTALKWAVKEMEERYRLMSKLSVRNVDSFNERIKQARKKGEVLMHKIQTGFDPETGKPVFEEQPIPQVEMPYIVIVVDEFADLMLVAGKEVERAIQRLAQMARAAGIHLIMATQRPSVDVITGVIKANFPTRISFQVTSKIDSRTILGEGGAEQLLGRGDMLYMAAGGRLKRIHGPFVSDDEIKKVVTHLKEQGAPEYIEGITVSDDDEDEGGSRGSSGKDGYDKLYDEAVAIIVQEGKISTSFIQRHLQIGYNRAARIVECMERDGVISPANHAGRREILIEHNGR